MSKSTSIIKYLLLIFLIAVAAGCATAKQNPFEKKRKTASRVNASQLGRNKYYFSSGYQKKLVTGYKKKK
jgi:uncharacterized membrane protein